jgi:ribosomal protein L20A (L18A)
VEQVLADVSARAQVSPKDVQVVRVEAVDWPDSCLGCTHPGQACLEVITPGYRILVRAAGQEYEYHASRTEVVFCPQQQPGDWGEAQPQVERVVADLAARLGISPEEIVVQEVREVEWRDSSLGCPKPGYGYLQVITPGYQILLQARGRTYDYRTDRGEIFLLCEP